MRTSVLVPAVLALGLASTLLVVACSTTTVTSPPAAADPDAGSSGTSGGDGDASPVVTGPMVLTSTAFVEGDVLPALHTCDGEGAKKEVSPALSWTPGPEGTLSYAIVFTDTTTDFLHSAVYDIPADVTTLAEGALSAKYELATPAGAKQSLSYKGVAGYAGPCPPDGEHTYEFAVYALKVDAVAGLTKDSKVAAAKAAILKDDLAVAKLTAKYTLKK